MADEIIVRVFDIVGSLSVSTDDGQIIHDKIAPLLREGKKVVISFANVQTLISAFLNAAIGQLYGEFPEERLRELLEVRDLTAQDRSLLQYVIKNAKSYFANREEFDRAWQDEVGEEDESNEE